MNAQADVGSKHMLMVADGVVLQCMDRHSATGTAWLLRTCILLAALALNGATICSLCLASYLYVAARCLILHKGGANGSCSSSCRICRRKNRCKEQAAALAAGQQQNTFTDVTPAQAKHRKEYRDASVTCLATEVEHGNVEYKYKIGCITNENRQQQLVSVAVGVCFYHA